MKRPHRWQLEKQRTAKAIRELPKCDVEGCTGRAMGWLQLMWPGEQIGRGPRQLCPMHVQEFQRAQRERT